VVVLAFVTGQAERGLNAVYSEKTTNITKEEKREVPRELELQDNLHRAVTNAAGSEYVTARVNTDVLQSPLPSRRRLAGKAFTAFS
jgi:hypothetical protein